METYTANKKPASVAPETGPRDWHPADIKAALEKAGWSLRRLSVANGYCDGTLKRALRHPWPRAEAIIAKAIGKTPEEIWPSRYDPKIRPERRGQYRSRKPDTQPTES